MNAYLYGFGASGGAGGTLTVTAPAGVTVTVSKDGKTKTKTAGADGLAVFKGLKSGQWTLTITDGEQTATKTVEITTDYSTVMSFNQIPSFDYSGDCEIVNDADEPITVSQDNWKIRFLTSGTLTFTELNGAEDGIDVFCVGGGGGTPNKFSGGGGGGYTATQRNIRVEVGKSYSIVVGSGGTGTDGGESSFDAFLTAKGGHAAAGGDNGADGGSGGGGYNSGVGYNGGSDGSDGDNTNGLNRHGKGQGTTTREFGESAGKLYAGGGGGGNRNGTDVGKGGEGGGADGDSDASANTGGGAGGRSNSGVSCVAHAGGSGIVIIRNAREVA